VRGKLYLKGNFCEREVTYEGKMLGGWVLEQVSCQ